MIMIRDSIRIELMGATLQPETPYRVQSAWWHMLAGYGMDLDGMTTFASACDDMVVQKNIPIYSVCEHHLLPMFGVAHIGYIPNGQIIGLSKLKRIADVYARRLQVQERLTGQVGDALQSILEPRGVAVVTKMRHLCMEMRGIETAGTETIAHCLHGAMRDGDARSEFLSLVNGSL